MKTCQLGRKTEFIKEQERELADFVFKTANIFHGLAPRELHHPAYDFAEADSIKHKILH
jgi:hypothetical protein